MHPTQFVGCFFIDKFPLIQPQSLFYNAKTAPWRNTQKDGCGSMKRILFIFAGTVTILGLLGIGKEVMSRQLPPDTQQVITDPTAATQAQSTHPTLVGMPRSIPGTPLVVHALGEYEGPFLEDGTDAEMVGACAILENTSSSYIARAEVVMIQDGNELIFEATFLPPKSKILVIEKNESYFAPQTVDSCRCDLLTYLETPAYDDRVYVSGDGECSMIVTNLTREPIDQVQIFYKQYAPEGETYLGGITYCANVTDLSPGESLRITPYHYLVERGRIVAVSIP